MQIRLTSEAVTKLRTELAELEKRERPRVAERIKTARAYGDLSENYEYHAAKEEQGMLEARIRELRAVLDRAKLVEAGDEAADVAGLGKKVTVFNQQWNEEMVYTIVTMVDADPSAGKISDASPIGASLMGKKAGDTVEYDSPAGKQVLEIRKIELGQM